MKPFALFLLMALTPFTAACESQGTEGYVPGVYRLETIDGTGFDWGATLDLTVQGRITGQAPCNSYSAAQEAPYPEFMPGPIAATRRACLHMNGETEFFAALRAMTRAEMVGPVLTLTDGAGREMVFRRDP